MRDLPSPPLPKGCLFQVQFPLDILAIPLRAICLVARDRPLPPNHKSFSEARLELWVPLDSHAPYSLFPKGPSGKPPRKLDPYNPWRGWGEGGAGAPASLEGERLEASELSLRRGRQHPPTSIIIAITIYQAPGQAGHFIHTFSFQPLRTVTFPTSR